MFSRNIYRVGNIFANGLNILCKIAGSGCMSSGRCAVTAIDIYTLVILQTNVPDFVEPSNRPSNSTDLNPVDYSIFGALQQLVYRQKFKNIDHLKQVLNWLNTCWQERHHRNGHYGHGHSTFRRAMVTNDFGHSTFCITYCLRKPLILQYLYQWWNHYQTNCTVRKLR